MKQNLCSLAIALCALSLVLVAWPDGNSNSTKEAASTPPATEQASEVEPSIESPTPQPSTLDTTTTTTSAPTTIAPSVRPVLSEGIDNTAADAGWTKPELGELGQDPAYGTAITRLTSADGTRFNRNTYSRRNPENADGTFFFTYHGDATYNVYDISDGSLVHVTDIHPDGEPQWHPTDPNRIRHLAGDDAFWGDLRLYETDVLTGEVTVVADLTEQLTSEVEDAHYLSDRAEGAPSADGNRYAWLVYNENEDPIAIASYDLRTNTLGATLTIEELPSGVIDWVSVSPTGDHVMLSSEAGVFVYDYSLSDPREIHDKGEHSDIALSASGEDVYVHVDFSADSPTAGWVVARNLVTGETTQFFDLYDNANTSIHFSGKGYDAPGWVVASTYNCKEDVAWSCEKVFAFNIDTGQIVNLAHTYNCGAEYWTETHAATNRDLTRVYFNSDGGSCGIDAEVYRLDVPALPNS